MHGIWGYRSKSEWFTIYMTRLFAFFRAILRHFVGDKNDLVELHNKTTIVA